MSCFLLPKTLLKEFQLMAVDLFWHDGERRKVHWLAWDKLCSSKLDGGLGFLNLEAFNLALLAKQLWRLLTWPDCLVSKVLKAKYFPRNHLFDAKDIQLMYGRTTSFRVITPAPHNAQSLRVCDLILEDTREWNVPVVNSLFWLEDRDVIFQIPLSFSRELDVMGISLAGIPPSAGKTKINFDGAILDRGAAMGVGIVARDSAEVCLAWQSLRLERIGSTLVAEAYAARAATLMAWRLQWQEEGNSFSLPAGLDNVLGGDLAT
ncbi:UNVERIFIED_CONTAM: putative mitochondrial protein [Sesamum calycinum]|uniref:Mitochondrial protein n=1 Tax=Sesamum calycinum TaxID=2727403 RepID=A0AAW2LU25_9LAMI